VEADAGVRATAEHETRISRLQEEHAEAISELYAQIEGAWLLCAHVTYRKTPVLVLPQGCVQRRHFFLVRFFTVFARLTWLPPVLLAIKASAAEEVSDLKVRATEENTNLQVSTVCARSRTLSVCPHIRGGSVCAASKQQPFTTHMCSR